MTEELNIGMKCVKYMLFIANFMFVMIGLLLISIGATIKYMYEQFDEFMDMRYFSPATLTISIGILMFFVAFVGCIGAVRESTCLINLFGLFLSLVLLLEICTSITAYSLQSNIRSAIRENMKESLKLYSDTYERNAWDTIQSGLQCCGIDGPYDWKGVAFNFTMDAPQSCCTWECRSLYDTGCLNKLSLIVSESSLLLGCGVLAVALVQFLGVIFAGLLASAVRKLKTQNLVNMQLKRDELQVRMSKRDEEKLPNVLYTNYAPDQSEA